MVTMTVTVTPRSLNMVEADKTKQMASLICAGE
jgi:hypothetical protein